MKVKKINKLFGFVVAKFKRQTINHGRYRVVVNHHRRLRRTLQRSGLEGVLRYIKANIKSKDKKALRDLFGYVVKHFGDYARTSKGMAYVAKWRKYWLSADSIFESDDEAARLAKVALQSERLNVGVYG